MKTETLFASIFLSLLTCLSVALAAPVPTKGQRVKGYKLLSDPPPPGHSGVHYDEGKNRVNVHYGDKDMVKHMEHTMYNQRKHPENDRAFKAGKAGDTTNRNKALANVNVGGRISKDNNGKWNKYITKKKLHDLQRSNDEKPHNSMKHDGKKVTVRPLPRIESDRERNLMSTATGKARRTPGAEIHFHANPGPNYHGRGDRSLSRVTVRNPSREKPAWNAGPGKRSQSSGPYAKGKHPEPKTTPKEARQPRGRSTTPKSIGGRSPSRSPSAGPSKQKERSRSRSRSSSRSPSPKGGEGKSRGGRTPSPKPKTPSPGPSKSKGKQKAVESPKKPAWNAGPGAQRKSERLAAGAKPKVATKPAATTKKTGKK